MRTTTLSGEAIVILPEAEFERLRELAEDTLDQRSLDLSQTRLAAGDEDLLTEADLEALRIAASPLAFWRAHRGKDLATLAQACAIDEVVLRAMEQGAITGERSLYERLARALDIDVEDVLPEPAA